MSTLVTQSRNASFIASLSVREPVLTGIDLGAEQPHPGDVERLPLGVDLAHVDDALEAEQRAGGGGGDAVLTGAGLGDDPRLAHPLGEQRLTEHVVDLVRAGVVEVLALEQDPRAAGVLGRAASPRSAGDGPAGVVAQQPVELGDGTRGSPRGLGVLRVELVERGDQRLGDEPAAVSAEVAALSGTWPDGLRDPVGSPAARGAARWLSRCIGRQPRPCWSTTGAQPAADQVGDRGAAGRSLVTSPSPTSTASAPARGVRDAGRAGRGRRTRRP